MEYWCKQVGVVGGGLAGAYNVAIENGGKPWLVWSG